MSIHRIPSLFLRLWLGCMMPLTVQASADWPALHEPACSHLVRPGETLSRIAQHYGHSLQELLYLNQLDNTAQLLVGQVIYLPGDVETCQPLSAHPDAVSAYDHDALYEHYPSPLSQPQPVIAQPVIEAVDYNYIASQPADGVDKQTNTGMLALDKTVNNLARATGYTCSVDTENNPIKAAMLSTEQAVEPALPPVQAAFGERPYAYYGSSASATEVLQNFAASYYIPLVVAEDVSGEVNGKMGPLTPVDFLDHMANIYGFMWYFDGHTLYVYNGDATQQKIISLNYLSTQQLKQTLQKVGVWDDRFFWKAQPKEGLVFVSGPPRYVALISQTATLLDDKEGLRQKSQLTVCTFKLKYAWATDKRFSFRGEQIVVPGVATLLRNIIKGGGVAQLPKPNVTLASLEPAARVSRSLNDKTASAQDGNSERLVLNQGADAEAVYINADPRMNAVIVHDLTHKMTMYRELVQSLDKPSAQIEVSVSIIDIATSSLEALGVEYGNTRANGRSEFIFNSDQAKQGFPSFTTVISANIGSFNSKLNLLANAGKAKIVSRPSLLTLDNLEAVLDNSVTSYVKVEANQDAQLFPITSGTVVQVTPRIVKEQAGRKIHMSVNIQDGSGAGSSEGAAVPKVQNSTINTQAVVHESESLLIGGFFKENRTTAATKIPVLGDIPILGALFRTKSEEQVRQVRMFLITPRIVELKST